MNPHKGQTRDDADHLALDLHLRREDGLHLGVGRLQPDAAVPTALIVAEAVANAIEHGFAKGRSGQIVVTVTGNNRTGLTVTIDDDGHGLAEGFEAKPGTSLGLQIATSLAKGQGGRFDLERRDGTRAALRLPPHLLETTSDEPGVMQPGAGRVPPSRAEA